MKSLEPRRRIIRRALYTHNAALYVLCIYTSGAREYYWLWRRAVLRELCVCCVCCVCAYIHASCVYVCGICRRTVVVVVFEVVSRCARERKGAVYVGAMCASRLLVVTHTHVYIYLYTRSHTYKGGGDGASHTRTHTHRCSPVQVSRTYCVVGRRRRRWL